MRFDDPPTEFEREIILARLQWSDFLLEYDYVVRSEWRALGLTLARRDLAVRDLARCGLVRVVVTQGMCARVTTAEPRRNRPRQSPGMGSGCALDLSLNYGVNR